jgi:hypothetical protein
LAYYDSFKAKWALQTGTTAQKLAAVNGLMVAGPAIPMRVPTTDIYNCIVPSEWNALSSANQQNIRDILYMGIVDASFGTNVRAMLAAVFGAGTATRAAFIAAETKYDSPQIPFYLTDGYSRPFDMGDVAAAGVT